MQQPSSIVNTAISSSVAFLQPPEELLTQLAGAPATATATVTTSSSSSKGSAGGLMLLRRANWTALVLSYQEGDVSVEGKLNRWPSCGDLGTGGGMCVVPGSGRVLLTGVTMEKNQGSHGGK